MNRLGIKLKTVSNWSRTHWIQLLSSSVALLLFFFISNKWYQAEWTGFGKDSTVLEEETLQKNGKFAVTKRITQFQSGKTLWDWLGLAGVIAIPIVLFRFQQQQQQKSEKQAEVEKEIAATNLREEALQNYIDKIAELLIDKKLKLLLKHLSDGSITKDDPELDAALDVARARTLSILRRLDGDGERKGNVVQFLIDAELIQGLELLKEANLSGATLSFTDLSNANLVGANLSNANLVGTDLSNASLVGTDLSNADLSFTDLSNANFLGANLSNANLVATNLSNAYLVAANLYGVKDLTPEQIKAANNWEKAKYSSNLRKQLGLPPENAP